MATWTNTLAKFPLFLAFSPLLYLPEPQFPFLGVADHIAYHALYLCIKHDVQLLLSIRTLVGSTQTLFDGNLFQLVRV